MRVYPINQLPNTIIVGKQSEHGVNEVRIDCAPWLALWPDLSISLWVTPPKGAGAYPADAHMEGDLLVWEVGAADTATAGSGYMELMGTADGVKKLSATTVTRVLGTTTGTTTEPPEAAQPWVDNVLDAAARAEKSAERAEEVAENLAGVSGEDGFSPTVNVEPIEGGYRVTITDKNGPHSFDVMNGAQGDAQPSIGARIVDVDLFADKWVGDESPYSQVVYVPTVTDKTQVDLTPSAEQLAIFHDKDLGFVTENDGGVVTVYAIGQKPANDYTIQATLMEVSV